MEVAARKERDEAGREGGKEGGAGPERKPQPLPGSRSLPLPLSLPLRSIDIAEGVDRLPRPTEKTRASPALLLPLRLGVGGPETGSEAHEPWREGRLKRVSMRSVALRSVSPDPAPRRVGEGEEE